LLPEERKGYFPSEAVAFTNSERLVGHLEVFAKKQLSCKNEHCRRKAIHSADFAFVTITMIAPEPPSVVHVA
jgi:hypothetical protein